MAYSVNWTTGEISIPVSDLTLISGTEYRLPMSDFLTGIRNVEWGFNEGLSYDQILEHTDPKTLSGVNYAAFDVINSPYTITLDPSATKVTLEGSNNNLIDVLNINGVSVISSNSAGLVVTAGGGSLTAADVWNYALENIAGTNTIGGFLKDKILTQDKLLKNKTETNPVTGVMTVYDDDNTTVLFTANIWENIAGTTPYAGNAVNRRDRLT